MRLAHRLVLYSVALIGALTIVIVTLIDRRLHRRIEDDNVAQLAREARLVAAQWAPASDPLVLARAAGLALGHRVTLIRADGVVAGDSDFDSAGVARLENHAGRPEVRAARARGEGWSRRASVSRGDEELYVAVPAATGGVARVSSTTRVADEMFVRTRRDVITAGGAAVVVAALLAVAFAGRVSRPVIELRDVARALAEHDFGAAVPADAPGEIGELAVALSQLSRQLEALDTMRRDFVANVSHELRTPLTVIGGFAETLVEDDVPPESRKRFAETIRANTLRMQRIVDDLLDLSRIESGGWVPKPQLTDLRAAVQETLALVATQAERKGVAVEAAVAPEADVAHLDRTALRQILTNLAENAIRHTPAGGRVTIFTEPDRQGFWAGVRDTGEGIAPEHLPRVFERFYRADPARSREDGGTGLGLAIVRHLAEAHGGRVQAESELGRGTTIRVFFPAV